MEKKTSYAVVMFFVLCEIAAKDFHTPLGTFKTNCFLREHKDECLSSFVQLYGITYACEMVLNLNFTIQKIGLVDNQTLVHGGDSQTYVIDEIKEEARVVDEVIPPFENIVDINNNTYFLANGSNYVMIYNTGEVIEIITGNKSLNQLAMNVDGRTLFILKPRENEGKNSDYTGGDFYVSELYKLLLYSKYSSHKATLDKLKKHVTAISTLDGKLLLGLRTGYDTGKLIRLIRIPSKSYPCKIQERISHLNERYVDFLVENCEDRASNLPASGSFFNDTLNSLTAENIALKLKLDEAQSNCNTPPVKSNSKMINIGSRHTRNASPEDGIDVIYGSPPKWLRSRREETEECPPAYKIQLENGNWKARLRIMTSEFDNLFSSIYTLIFEIEVNLVPAAEEVESYEEGYRRPKKCLEVYELNALTDNIERLEQVEKNLRLKLLEYTLEAKAIVDEEYPERGEDDN